MAAAAAALILSLYQLLSQMRARELLREQSKSLRSAYFHRAAVERIDDHRTLYANAWDVIQSGTGSCILSTDLRFYGRSKVDQERQAAYLDHVIEYLKRNPERQLFRAIGAVESETDAMHRLNAKLLSDDLKDQVEIKYYRNNPVCLDVMVGDQAVLLAFPDPAYQYRTGLVIWDVRVAERLRHWYMVAVWNRDDLTGARYIRSIADMQAEPDGQLSWPW